MPRVVGIDPGTVSIDVCGIDDGRLFLDRSFPTGRALAEPAAFVALLDAAGPPALAARPPGYSLPLPLVQESPAQVPPRPLLSHPRGACGLVVRNPPRRTLP